MAESELFHALTDNPLFSEFTDDELQDVIAHGEACTYRPGERIIEAGTSGTFLGVVLEGSARAEKRDDTGQKNVLGDLPEGTYFGEVSLVSGDETTADVVAASSCTIFQIPHEVMSEALATHPKTMQRVARTITERLSKQSERPAEAESAIALDAEPEGERSVARILTIDYDGDSLQYRYYDTGRETNDMSGKITGLSETEPVHTARGLRWEETEKINAKLSGAVDAILRALAAGPTPSLQDPADITVVAHQLPHAAEKYSDATVADDSIIDGLTGLPSALGAANDAPVRALRKFQNALSDVPQVAVFDTAFFSQMPPHAFLYALPYQWYTDHGLRRYGARGLIHQQAAVLAASHLQQPLTELNIITCELGPQSSVCAVQNGRAIDVSVGLSSTEGLPGAATCGDIDPGIIARIPALENAGMDEALNVLSESCGITGLAGDAESLEELTELAEDGDQRANLALDVLCYRLCKYFGAYFAALGSVDALVLTGPAVTDLPDLRARICGGLEALDVALDPPANQSPWPDARGVSDISEPDTGTRVLVTPTDASRMAASIAAETIGLQQVRGAIIAGRRPIPIGISVRHLHLSRGHVQQLFGQEHQLTFRAPLTQPGQFACEETVDVVGPKRTIEGVRVLGPERSATQVEVSRTDGYQLGVEAPLCMSGELEDSPGIELVGPEGTVQADEGLICARRHLHASPEQAMMLGVRHGDEISVRVEGQRSLVFGEVKVRVHPDYRLDMHIDTDEANAARLEQGSVGYVESIDARA